MIAVALAAAAELELWPALAAPVGVDALAASRGLDARRLRWLLRVLAAAGHLAREVTPDGERFTAGARVAPAVAPVAGSRLLAAVLRRARPLDWLEVAGNPDAAALTASAAIARAVEAAPEVAAVLAPRLGDGVVLDAGCGPGLYLRAILAAAPAARAIAVDLPAVVREVPRTLGPLTARARLLAGDARAIALPGCRVALAANLIHVLAEADARALVARLAAALEPGGTLALKEVRLDDDGGGPPAAVALGLSLAVHGPGDLVSPARLETWLAEAGLTRIRRVALAAAPESLLVLGEAAQD